MSQNAGMEELWDGSYDMMYSIVAKWELMSLLLNFLLFIQIVTFINTHS